MAAEPAASGRPDTGRPLHVGLVCPYAFDTPGGVQNHVLGLASWLGSQGHRVQVLAPGRIPPELHRRYGSPQVVSTGRAHPVTYNGSVARVSLAAGRTVQRWLEESDLDLLHVHEPLTPGASLQVLRRPGPPVVATFHTATPRSRGMQLAGRVMAGRLARVQAAIAVSEAARRVVVEHLGLDATVIGNGFAAGADAERGRLPGLWSPGGRDVPGLRIAFLGRLDEPRKGLDVLVAAWPDVRARWPGASVVVAGSGSRRLPPGWTELGPISDEERARLLAWCDVFVAPHRDRESFGLVLLEALSAGATVVAADLPAFVDVVGEAVDQHAHFFRRGDAADLVRALGVALGEGADRAPRRPPADRPGAPDAVAPGSEDALALLRARYDWSTIGAQVLQVYRSVLPAGSAPAATPTPRPVPSPRP